MEQNFITPAQQHIYFQNIKIPFPCPALFFSWYNFPGVLKWHSMVCNDLVVYDPSAADQTKHNSFIAT